MHKFANKLYFIFFATFVVSNIYSQPIADSVYNSNIHTVQLYKEGWELSNPIIRLNSDEKLKLGFDEFGSNVRNFSYTIIHCNSNWESSGLSYNEYSNGFEQNQIITSSFSTNTLVDYVHYSMILPNENCAPLLSGNYILKVFEDFNPDKILFTKRFYVVENSSAIELKVERPDIPKYMMKYHQYRIKVDVMADDYSDLRTEIKTRIMQNFNPYTLKDCYLSHLDGNSLYYDDPDSAIMLACNEFRNFDLKSIKYQSARIQSITYNNTLYDVVLYPDEWRNKKLYYSDNDINGNYYIANTVGINKDRDADYQMIYFNLPAADPVLDGHIFVLGSLTDWRYSNSSKMNYNFRTKAYELKLFLKQGYYNYQFAFKPLYEEKVDLTYVEGSHYETENDYHVFVYYKPSSSRYERLIGYTMDNSIKK